MTVERVSFACTQAARTPHIRKNKILRMNLGLVIPLSLKRLNSVPCECFSRQVARSVVGLACQLGHFLAKARAVVALGVRKQICLPLIVPAFRIEALRLFKVGNRLGKISSLVKMLGQTKLRRSQSPIGIRHRHRLSRSLFAKNVGAAIAFLYPVA